MRRTDRVMLKPNLNGGEGCTNRDLVEALIQLLSDSGVAGMSIGESTFGDARMTDLFRFSCPIASAFGYESLVADKTHVFLNPRNYNPHGDRTSGTDATGDTITNYYISNPGAFWAAPPVE